MNDVRMTWSAALLVSLPLITARAEDKANPITHPEQRLDQETIQKNRNDIQKDQASLTVTQDELNAKKVERDQAKATYEEALKNGPDSDVAKDAKKRYTESEREYRKLAKLQRKHQQSLRQDRQELRDAQTELQKDRAGSSH